MLHINKAELAHDYHPETPSVPQNADIHIWLNRIPADTQSSCLNNYAKLPSNCNFTPLSIQPHPH